MYFTLPLPEDQPKTDIQTYRNRSRDRRWSRFLRWRVWSNLRLAHIYQGLLEVYGHPIRSIQRVVGDTRCLRITWWNTLWNDSELPAAIQNHASSFNRRHQFLRKHERMWRHAENKRHWQSPQPSAEWSLLRPVPSIGQSSNRLQRRIRLCP